MGDRLGQMQEAVARLAPEVEVLRVAGVYETAPMYVVDQPAFLNSAVAAQTSLGPFGLLARLKAIEESVGRSPRQRYGPREIDVDLIAYGCLRYRFDTADRTVLHVPHPAIADRRFVVQPLSDLGVEFLPGHGPLSALLAATESQAESVRRIDAELQVRR